MATGLALKVTTAWALIPFALIVRRRPIGWRLAASAAMLTPALAWYAHAWTEVTGPSTGSSASADNARVWLRSLSPAAWLRLSTYADVGGALAVRSFTPVGFVLAGWGLVASGKLDRLWVGWGVGCALSLLGLASKWHHAYYWMVVAPLAAVGVARGLVAALKFGRGPALILGSSFLGLCLAQSASTWRTPVELASLLDAAREVTLRTTADQLVIAPEALLHYAGRRGYRLEFGEAACRRAAGEWRDLRFEPDGPLALTEFYRHAHSVKYAGMHPAAGAPRDPGIIPDHVLIADVGSVADDPGRLAWRRAIRGRPATRIIADRPGLMIAELR